MRTARENYQYPAAHIRPGDKADFEAFAYVRPLEPEHHQNGLQFESTNSLDTYHYNLLTSNICWEQIVGVASVIYWGNYFTRGHANHGIANSRVRQFFYGNSSSNVSANQVGFDVVCDHLNNARVLINDQQYGHALAEVMQIPRLSRSFGSKVLAFMSPETIGVYDIHISRYINRPDLAMASTGDLSVNDIAKFQNYCEHLIETAEAQNNLDEPFWTDWDEIQRPWRAVDVERAMFITALGLAD